MSRFVGTVNPAFGTSSVKSLDVSLPRPASLAISPFAASSLPREEKPGRVLMPGACRTSTLARCTRRTTTNSWPGSRPSTSATTARRRPKARSTFARPRARPAHVLIPARRSRDCDGDYPHPLVSAPSPPLRAWCLCPAMRDDGPAEAAANHPCLTPSVFHYCRLVICCCGMQLMSKRQTIHPTELFAGVSVSPPVLAPSTTPALRGRSRFASALLVHPGSD